MLDFVVNLLVLRPLPSSLACPYDSAEETNESVSSAPDIVETQISVRVPLFTEWTNVIIPTQSGARIKVETPSGSSATLLISPRANHNERSPTMSRDREIPDQLFIPSSGLPQTASISNLSSGIASGPVNMHSSSSSSPSSGPSQSSLELIYMSSSVPAVIESAIGSNASED